jgi:manganese/zinc/iron transport system permease protein
MLLFSGAIGAVSGVVGAYISSVGNGMPTGPWVVVSLSVFALFAILFGKEKGLIARIKLRKENHVKINNENILKDLFHSTQEGSVNVDMNEFQSNQRYLPKSFKKVLKRLERNDLVDLVKGKIVLNEKGLLAAKEVVRKHRLWELYLSKYFYLAADHLHDDAEGIEHVITPEIEKHLTELLDYPDKDPHQSKIPY